MRLVLLPLLISFLSGCDKNSGQPSEEASVSIAPAPEESVEQAKAETLPSKPTEKFEGSFRESFSHSDLLTIHHDPHGGAARVSFSYKDRPVGFLYIRESPPKGSEAILGETGKDYLKKRYGVGEVEHRVVTNSKGNACHRFSAKIPGEVIDKQLNKPGSEGYVTLMAIFSDNQTGGTAGQELTRAMFGTFQFEFVIPESDVAAVSAEIEKVIDTFELPETGAGGKGGEGDGEKDAE